MSLDRAWLGRAAPLLFAGVAACVGSVGAASGVDAGVDAGADPLNATPRCTSGVMWTPADGNTRHMRPGEGCAASSACHGAGAAALVFSVAGTVYATGHEPDDCSGVDVGAPGAHLVSVVVTDATGDEESMLPNNSGNFYLTQPVVFPAHVKVTDMMTGTERAMAAAVTSGDCDGCHSQSGANQAPGRITVP